MISRSAVNRARDASWTNAPAPNTPVIALLVPGDFPTGNVAITDADGKAVFQLSAGITYRFRAVIGNVTAESDAVTAPGETVVEFPALIGFKVKLLSDGEPQIGVDVEALDHQLDPLTGVAVDVPLGTTSVTNVQGEASFTIEGVSDGFRFLAVVNGFPFTSEVFQPEPGDILIFDVGPFANITVFLRSGTNAGIVGGQTMKAFSHEVDPGTGQDSDTELVDAVTTIDTERKGDHWLTGTTDAQGHVEFTVPDPAVYSQTEDWDGTGFLWHAPNIEGWAFFAHTQVKNLWCTDCPPDAAGATNPHFFEPEFAFPPLEVVDPFAIVGFTNITVSTSAGFNGTNMRLYIHRSNGTDGHWLTSSISNAKAEFTAPDYSVYSKDWEKNGTGWRFYRESDGAWSGVVTTPFAYPPNETAFNH